MHVVVTECGRRVAYQGHVIPQFHCKTASGLDAGIGKQSYSDDMSDSALLKLKIEIGIGESALRPVLFDDDVISVRDEIRMPFSAPASLGERLQLLYQLLTGVRMIPAFVIARLPSAMRHEEDPDAAGSRTRDDRTEMFEKTDFVRNLLHHWPDFSPVLEGI